MGGGAVGFGGGGEGQGGDAEDAAGDGVRGKTAVADALRLCGGGGGEEDGGFAGAVAVLDDVQAGVSAAFAYREAEGWKLPDRLNAALDKVVNLGTIRAK